jgi:hypothetical protein
MPSDDENCNMFLLRNLDVKVWFDIKLYELFREIWSNILFLFILLFVCQIVGYPNNVNGSLDDWGMFV